LVESPSWTFYFLGFNARNAPFSNPRFRRVLAQLVDKEWLAKRCSTETRDPWQRRSSTSGFPESLESGTGATRNAVPGADGEVNANAVQLAFEDAGFRYDEQDRLRVRQ